MISFEFGAMFDNFTATLQAALNLALSGVAGFSTTIDFGILDSITKILTAMFS